MNLRLLAADDWRSPWRVCITAAPQRSEVSLSLTAGIHDERNGDVSTIKRLYHRPMSCRSYRRKETAKAGALSRLESSGSKKRLSCLLTSLPTINDMMRSSQLALEEALSVGC